MLIILRDWVPDIPRIPTDGYRYTVRGEREESELQVAINLGFREAACRLFWIHAIFVGIKVVWVVGG